MARRVAQSGRVFQKARRPPVDLEGLLLAELARHGGECQRGMLGSLLKTAVVAHGGEWHNRARHELGTYGTLLADAIDALRPWP